MKKLSLDGFIDSCKKVHGDRYDYSLVDYINSKTKIRIICPEHGVFEQLPHNHLCKKTKCPKCSFKGIGEKVSKIRKKTKPRLTEKLCDIHNFYIKKSEKNQHINSCIKCEIQKKYSNNIRNKYYGHTTDSFINTVKIVHNNFYDYSSLIYIDSKTKVKIICPKHGEFEQNPNNHLHGNGCPSCNTSKGELKVKSFLDDNLIKYIQQHSFPDCRYKLPLKFDFYLPNHNTCIEYDGVQHFRPHNLDKSGVEFERTKKCDEIKNNYCKKNNIKLIRIKYNDNYNLYELFIKNNILTI
jgi:hypothetical protein